MTSSLINSIRPKPRFSTQFETTRCETRFLSQILCLPLLTRFKSFATTNSKSQTLPVLFPWLDSRLFTNSLMLLAAACKGLKKFEFNELCLSDSRKSCSTFCHAATPTFLNYSIRVTYTTFAVTRPEDIFNSKLEIVLCLNKVQICANLFFARLKHERTTTQSECCYLNMTIKL